MINRIISSWKLFMQMKRGSKLIIGEAAVLWWFLFIFITVLSESVEKAVVISAILAVAYICCLGLFKTFAWLFALVFSVFWGLLGYFVSYEFSSRSIGISLIVAVIMFIISMFLHKTYSGLYFSDLSESYANIKEKRNRQNAASNISSKAESVRFCDKCGRRITSQDGKCSFCDK